MFQHVLKVHPEQLRLLALGLKRFEFRKDDRTPAFQAGDELLEFGWDPKAQERTGEWLRLRVTHVSRGGEFGVPEGFAVLSIVLAATMDELRPVPFGQLPLPEDFGRPGEPPPRPVEAPTFRANDVRSFGEKPVEIEAPRAASDCADCRDADPPGECAKCRDFEAAAVTRATQQHALTGPHFVDRPDPNGNSSHAERARRVLNGAGELLGAAGTELVVYDGTIPRSVDAKLGPGTVDLLHVAPLHEPGGTFLHPEGLELVAPERRFAFRASGRPCFARLLDRNGRALLQLLCGLKGSGAELELELFQVEGPMVRVATTGEVPEHSVVGVVRHRIALATA
jgi:hypothetical protein